MTDISTSQPNALRQFILAIEACDPLSSCEEQTKLFDETLGSVLESFPDDTVVPDYGNRVSNQLLTWKRIHRQRRSRLSESDFRDFLWDYGGQDSHPLMTGTVMFLCLRWALLYRNIKASPHTSTLYDSIYDVYIKVFMDKRYQW